MATAVWSGNTLTKAYVRNDRLLLDFAKPFALKDFHTFRLLKPGSVRYVFDLHRTRIGSSKVPLGLHHPNVRSFRISQYKPDTVRIVVETAEPYRMIHGRRAATTYGITLPATKKVAIGSLFSDLKTGKNSPKNAAKTSAKTKPPKPTAPSRPTRHRYTVVLDPGHGGHDTGAIGGGKREKRLVLQIAKRVRSHLQKMGFSVLMTRSTDRFVRLRDRTRYANRKHGDVFVSIHANSIGNPKKRHRSGIETYFLQPSRSARAKRVAARENSVVLRKSDRLSQNVILNAVMTGPKIVLSNKLAIDIQRHMLGNVRRRYTNVQDGGVRSAPFWVLVGAEMPAVLVEVGYLSNRTERKRLFSPRYQELLAKGIAQGIANYLRNREREIE
jgi:N-acetylmuramoyl-L-alanine amidase